MALNIWVLARVLVAFLKGKGSFSFKTQQAPEQAPVQLGAFSVVKIGWGCKGVPPKRVLVNSLAQTRAGAHDCSMSWVGGCRGACP